MAHSVTIRGQALDVSMPPLDLRQDIVYSYGQKWKSNRTGMPLQRVCAAAVVLCVPEVAFGLRAANLGNARDDIFAFGGEAFCSLTERGWTPSDILTAGNDLVGILVAETFPNKKEVEKARGKSESGEPSEKPSA